MHELNESETAQLRAGAFARIAAVHLEGNDLNQSSHGRPAANVRVPAEVATRRSRTRSRRETVPAESQSDSIADMRIAGAVSRVRMLLA